MTVIETSLHYCLTFYSIQLPLTWTNEILAEQPALPALWKASIPYLNFQTFTLYYIYTKAQDIIISICLIVFVCVCVNMWLCLINKAHKLFLYIYIYCACARRMFIVFLHPPPPLSLCIYIYINTQGILKGEVSLYRWPPVLLVWISLFCK